MDKNDDFKEDFRLIGLKIAYYRKKKGLTQSELSEMLDHMNTSYIGSLEAPNMHRTLTLTTLFRIAEALEIHPKKLLDYDKNE